MKKILLLSFLTMVSSLLSQEYISVNPPENYGFSSGNQLFSSPDVNAFQKYHFQDVNLYTGKTKIVIPIFEIKTGKISLPISLTYNSGGIKIDDISSNVGAGWNLNAGGNVIRIIKDIDDNKMKIGKYAEPNWDYGVECYKYVSVKGFFRNFSLEPGGNCGVSTGYNLWAKEDASPDLFIANAPGLNTKFYIKKEEVGYSIKFLDGNGNKATTYRDNFDFTTFGFNNNDIKGLEAIDELLDGHENGYMIKEIVEPVDYKEFMIKNLNGIEYKFTDVDAVESISNYVSQGWLSPIEMISLPLDLIEAGRRLYNSNISAWNLTQIKDFNNNKINFIYEKYEKPTINVTKNHTDDALRYDANPNTSLFNNDVCKYGHIPNFQSETLNIDEINLKNQYFYSISPQTNRISKIEWEGGSINFAYGHTRQDTFDEKALTEIIIKDSNNQEIKSFLFNYDYFISKENCSTWQCKRLKLNYIDEKGRSNQIQRYRTFEYDYSNPLPKVYSLQQDFLGYYNNNGTTTPDINSPIIKSPTLYYHKNLGKYSILPFQLTTTGLFTKIIPGDFSLEANDYSLSGLLKKITFPTGGYSEFEYENHKFLLLGQEYTAGGARIKKQKLNDGNGNERTLTYEYTENNMSSGYINGLPVYGYPWAYDQTKSSNNVSFITFDKNKGGIELTDGAFIGYSRVLEKEQGNGTKEYFFHSPKNFPNENDFYAGGGHGMNMENLSTCINILHQNSAFPNVNFIDNDIRRNKLYLEKTHNESNNLLIEKSYLYDYKLFSELNLNYQTVLDFYFVGSAAAPEPYNYNLRYASKIRTERSLLSETITKEYTPSGILETMQKYIYDETFPLVKQSKTNDSNGNELHIEYKYSPDLQGQRPFLDFLVAENRIAEPVQTKTYNSTQTNPLSIQETVYADFHPSPYIFQVLPKYVFAKKNSDVLNYSPTGNDLKITYDKYDIQGNLTQYTLADGIPVMIVWGYGLERDNGLLIGGPYPVAKIENPPTNDSDLGGFIYNLKNSSLSETDEWEIENTIRLMRSTYPDSMITGYTYDPLIGITTIIQPNGQKETYEYDASGRLMQVKDHNGKVIKKIDYNYQH